MFGFTVLLKTWYFEVTTSKPSEMAFFFGIYKLKGQQIDKDLLCPAQVQIAWLASAIFNP